MHFATSEYINKNQKYWKILLITTEKRSNTLLMRKKFIEWLNNSVSEFTIIYPNQLNPETMNSYDAVFTPNKDVAEACGAVLINFFHE